jgi:hypothetical protein
MKAFTQFKIKRQEMENQNEAQNEVRQFYNYSENILKDIKLS